MKQLLYRLERSQTTWFILPTLLFFFLLRFPSLIEPYWYGDEGIYETIGLALRHGRSLYTGIWDNKPPLLYLIYALFNSDQFLVHLASLIVGIGAVLCFFFLAKQLFHKNKIVYITTIIFCLLFGTPIAEGNIANAENFMLLPILAAAYIIYTAVQTKNRNEKNMGPWSLKTGHFVAGLLLGIAFLIKIVAFFDFAAFAVFLIYVYIPHKATLQSFLNRQVGRILMVPLLPYCLGFALPIVITILYFFLKGSASDFFQSAFGSNIGYVGYANVFIIPQGLLVLKLLLLGGSILFLFMKRSQISSPALFLLVWFAFGLFDSFFSQRNYTHYFLMVIPSLSLLLGLPTLQIRYHYKLYLFLGVFILAILSIGYFLNGRYNQIPYYSNFFAFVTNHKSVTDYQNFFDRNVPRDYMIADYLRLYTTPDEPIFIWGNSAQIYALSNTLPAGRYTVAYHVLSTKQTLAETTQAINTIKPHFIVILSDSPGLPINNVNYNYKISLGGSVVYERMAPGALLR